MTPKPMTSKSNYHHGDLRRALLLAAEQELSEKGVEAFSLRGVAKRAGVSHGAPAHHFEDARGLLTALAAVGYQRFIEAQEQRQKTALKDAESQLAASGLGYLDFATRNPALFRLMFSSERPDKSASLLAKGADAAFEKLVSDVAQVTKTDPHHDERAMTDVAAIWSITHGLADLLIANRLSRFSFLAQMTGIQRDEKLSEIILCACRMRPSPAALGSKSLVP